MADLVKLRDDLVVSFLPGLWGDLIAEFENGDALRRIL